MIHLVTRNHAQDEIGPWLQAGDRVVLLGEAVGGYNRWHAHLGAAELALFEEDASYFGLRHANCIDADSLVAWLEESPCRTWS